MLNFEDILEGIDAVSLNTKWDKLGLKFDNVFSQLNSGDKSTIQKALSDWQDWYYSEAQYEKWGDTSKWEELYTKISNIVNGIKGSNLAMSKKVKTKKSKKVASSDGYVKAEVVGSPSNPVKLPELEVKGRVPSDKKKMYIIAGVVFIGLLIILKK